MGKLQHSPTQLPEKSGHGAAFKYSVSGDTKKFVGYYFIDGSTIVRISPFPNTPTEDTFKLA